MLVRVPQHTQTDLALWGKWEKADRVHAMTSRFRSHVDQSLEIIREYLKDSTAYVGVSWGKDSVVVADLALRVDPSLRLVHIHTGRNTPLGALVEDAFLSERPHCTYAVVDMSPAKVGAKPHADMRTDWRDYEGFKEASKLYGSRRITGVRADESSLRKLSVRVHGASTGKSCRPLAYWSGQDIWAYMHLRELPSHPVYAMTRGGTYDRDRIRVGNLGGDMGSGHGRKEWELHYFPEEYRRCKTQRDKDHYND